jgi:3-phosphoshikimate 1-carboxyvinyltransferase
MADGLIQCGVDAKAMPDGIIIQGGGFIGGSVESHDDHRIAMAFTMAGLCASESVEINNCANVDTSFPNFVGLAASVGVKVRQL